MNETLMDGQGGNRRGQAFVPDCELVENGQGD